MTDLWVFSLYVYSQLTGFGPVILLGITAEMIFITPILFLSLSLILSDSVEVYQFQCLFVVDLQDGLSVCAGLEHGLVENGLLLLVADCDLVDVEHLIKQLFANIA